MKKKFNLLSIALASIFLLTATGCSSNNSFKFKNYKNAVDEKEFYEVNDKLIEIFTARADDSYIYYVDEYGSSIESRTKDKKTIKGKEEKTNSSLVLKMDSVNKRQEITRDDVYEYNYNEYGDSAKTKASENTDLYVEYDGNQATIYDKNVYTAYLSVNEGLLLFLREFYFENIQGSSLYKDGNTYTQIFENEDGTFKRQIVIDDNKLTVVRSQKRSFTTGEAEITKRANEESIRVQCVYKDVKIKKLDTSLYLKINI